MVFYVNVIIEYNERYKFMIYLNFRRIGKVKKIILFLLIVMLISVLVLLIIYVSERLNILVVYYFRYDGNYIGYNMWLW